MSALQSSDILKELHRAWIDSEPETEAAHEEGGFILMDKDGSLTVERWPVGERDGIEVPPHAGGQRAGRVIVATFHTHPNTGPDYLQEPSPTDVRAVVEDPDLHHPEYEGEYVISKETVYMIGPDGTVHALGETSRMLPGDG
jgi:hypothetical protein